MARNGERATKEDGRPEKHDSVSRLSDLGIDPKESERFQQIAEGAKDMCPISRALKGNVELSVNATLER